MTVDLVIAGRLIRLCSREGIIIRPDERFTAFTDPVAAPGSITVDTYPGIIPDGFSGMTDGGIAYVPGGAGPFRVPISEPDLIADVGPGCGEIPPAAVKVFDAQLMEEVPGGIVNSGEPFWEIFSGGGVTYARVFLKDPERTALLVMPHGEMRWRIFTGEHQNNNGTDCLHEDPSEQLFTTGSATGSSADAPSRKHAFAGRTDIILNPLPYPLDGLLLYFLFSRAGDIMIHGSGVSCHGRGWLFTGRSGSGKTTLARIFDQAGDRVIHDDRLVLRHEDSGWVMHNTPVYRNDEPRSAPLDHLWIIRHGTANVSEPVAGAEAVALILANCIQQNWDREAAGRLAAAADDLAATVRVSRLSFVPDSTVRDYLRLRKEEDMAIAAEAAESMLGAGKNITVTAGGYSMWPAVRPGDRVVIGPWSSGLAAAGRIVALRRDGGFVLHRITDVITSGGSEPVVTCGDAAVSADDAAGRIMIRTRGDASVRADEPSGPEAIAGIVISVIRRGRQLAPPRRRLPRWLTRAGAIVTQRLRRLQP